ncbi:4'-phosphopantetheinyl transferase family protein [Bacillus sp. FSL K6-3431]|uniref:4'-phosphopantetheinyl transferase family protein n=1 Tax=Bacillus sp. FSL K6-3431 TaxID=2921500 RepID=UPI0030F8E4D3
MKKTDRYSEIIAFKLGSPLPYKCIEMKLKELPNNERQRILRFHKLEDQQRTLFASLFIRKRLRILLPLPVHDLSIKRDQNGRPYLENFYGWEGDFNLSHSGEWIISGVTTTGRIGVDVEEVRPIDLSISKLCLTQEEIDHLQNTPPERQLSFFFSIWTLKEAFVKAIGQGLLFPMDSFGFDMDDWSQNKISIRNTNLSFSQFYFRLYQLGKNYIVAVCCTDLEHINNLCIKIMDRSDFL